MDTSAAALVRELVVKGDAVVVVGFDVVFSGDFILAAAVERTLLLMMLIILLSFRLSVCLSFFLLSLLQQKGICGDDDDDDLSTGSDGDPNRMRRSG